MTYRYAKTWSEPLIASSEFKHPEGHANPAAKPYESAEFDAGDTRVGAFRLPKNLQEKLQQFTPYEKISKDALPKSEQQRLTVNGSRFYRGKDPATPQVGDARISFATVPQGEVSLVARQVRGTFEPYGVNNQEIYLIEAGTLSAAALFQHAKQENATLAWILRGVFTLMLIIGIALLFGPLNALANVIPFVGNVTEAGTGCAAFGVGVALAAATVAVAWVTIRPLIGIPLFLVTITLIYLVASRGRKRRQQQ